MWPTKKFWTYYSRMLLLITKKLSLNSVIINESFYTAQSTYYLLWAFHATLFWFSVFLKFPLRVVNFFRRLCWELRTENYAENWRNHSNKSFKWITKPIQTGLPTCLMKSLNWIHSKVWFIREWGIPSRRINCIFLAFIALEINITQLNKVKVIFSLEIDSS